MQGSGFFFKQASLSHRLLSPIPWLHTFSFMDKKKVQAKPCKKKPTPEWFLYLLDRYNTMVEAIPFWQIVFIIFTLTAVVIIMGVTLFMMELNI